MPTSSRGSRAWVPVAVALALTASCASERSDTHGTHAERTAPFEATANGVVPPRVNPPVDLQAVVRRTALGFRSEGGAYASMGSTFDAVVQGSAIRITPRDPRGVGAGSTLSLETTLVARGSLVLADAARPATSPSLTLERDGAVTLQRGAVAERIENDDAGIEQSWRFDRMPLGEGDVVVRVRATGERYTASTDHGLHFASAAGPGLRYGTATWVDASGKRTVVPPRFDVATGEIVMAVPGAVIAASKYPAVLDPTLTPEQEVDKPVSGSSASGEQSSPTIVSAGPNKGYFAVWYDRRGARPSLYGARLASNGTVLDESGIAIATGVGSTVPFVSAADTGFLVTWSISYVDLYQSPGVYGVRLDAEGKPLDAAPITIVANQTNVQQPTSAFDGTSWLVTWQRYGGGPSSYDIVGARVPRTGALLDAVPIAISDAPEPEYQPLVTFDGTNHMVFWRSYNAIYARKVGKDGKPIGGRINVAASSGSSLYGYHTAFDGNIHLVVWSDYNVGSYDVFARRLDLAGTALDAGNITVAADPSYDERPRAVHDGSSFVITFSRSGQLMAQRMNAGGGLIDAAPLLINAAGNYYDYALASDRSGTIAVSRASGVGLAGSDVAGVNVGKPPAANAASFTVSKAANSETEPVSAWNGTNHFTVWLDTRDGRPAIYGASTNADGNPALPVKVVSDARFPNDLTRPRIASDGSGYLVVFSAYDPTANKRGIRGIRVDAAGKVEATGVFDIHVPLGINDFVQEPDVAFDGTNYLVVWQNQQNDGSSQTSIAGVRLGKTATTPLDVEPIRVTTATPVETRSAPSIAWDGQNYFVAWITARPTAAGGIQVSHVFGTRVTKEGSAIDGEQAVCNAFLLQRAPSVAGDRKNGGFMVVWEDYRTALETADVYGARISPLGVNLDGTSGMKIATGDYDESRPRVSASGDGTNWVVAWRDLRSKATYDIYGSWISLAGRNHDPAGLLFSAEAGDEDAPWLSPSLDGKLLFAYQRLDPRSGYGSYRVRARAINTGAKVAAACSKADDCSSRSCVDSVCCSTECGGCGACNVTPGTCTPRAAGAESPTCPAYKCKGTLECPNKCESDGDCAQSATCDPSTKTCVSRVICIDNQTLKDLTGKQTGCAPFKCIADACRTQCGSVDDCAEGFVCDYGGRCVQPPSSDDGGCAVSASAMAASSTSRASGSSRFAGAVLGGAVLALAALRRRRRSRADSADRRS